MRTGRIYPDESGRVSKKRRVLPDLRATLMQKRHPCASASSVAKRPNDTFTKKHHGSSSVVLCLFRAEMPHPKRRRRKRTVA